VRERGYDGDDDRNGDSRAAIRRRAAAKLASVSLLAAR
jgi:hypothetical protein